eukprot:8585254-Alexandrium_andersonii.AAC.1
MVRARRIATCEEASRESAVNAGDAPRLLDPKMLLPSVGRRQAIHAAVEIAYSKPRLSRNSMTLCSV